MVRHCLYIEFILSRVNQSVPNPARSVEAGCLNRAWNKFIVK